MRHAELGPDDPVVSRSDFADDRPASSSSPLAAGKEGSRDSFEEHSFTERLLKEAVAELNAAVERQRLASVAGHVQDPQAGSLGAQQIDQITAAQARHHYICYQEINFPVRLRTSERFRRVRTAHDDIPIPQQSIRHDLAKAVIVLYEQNMVRLTQQQGRARRIPAWPRLLGERFTLFRRRLRRN